MQESHHFEDDIFKCIFLNTNVLISIEISLKFIFKGPIRNIPSLVQILAWRRPGDKPLSEPMMIIYLTHICVSWLQWVKPNYMTKYVATNALTNCPRFLWWRDTNKPRNLVNVNHMFGDFVSNISLQSKLHITHTKSKFFVWTIVNEKNRQYTFSITINADYHKNAFWAYNNFRFGNG